MKNTALKASGDMAKALLTFILGWMSRAFFLGSSHRRYRHDPIVTPIEAKVIFGEGADNACLDHIRLDALESQRSVTTFWILKNVLRETKSVQPVVNFTINSYAGAWHFQSEAISFSKDGKTHFCFRSSVEEEDDDNVKMKNGTTLITLKAEP